MKKQMTLKKQPKKNPIRKKDSQKKYVMYGLGIAALLGGGYLAFIFFRNRRAQQRSIQEPITIPTPRDIVTRPILPVASSSSFPLRRGARGSLVQMIQKALLNKGEQAALIIKETSLRAGQPDGIFGRGTERALRVAGYPSALTQSQFTSLVGKEKSTSGFNPGMIANEIIGAANKRNLFGVLNGLKKIQNVNQYRQVSTFFQNVRILGIRVTSIVNALLSVAFRQKELEKVKIRAEFRRMGLKQNTRDVWFIPSLNGLEDFDSVGDQIENEWSLAIVRKPTLLKSQDGTFIVPEVLPKTVIGYITGIKNGTTQILTQSGETVFAPVQNVSIL
ncbi:peptidoglycan-binding domain-containing protein [Aquimarina celericrescens]|uniref:Peptidoglycan-binding protein n=1 Tax=Aquimarina celericrescens TaxID=1964542 RepID=A0ABW5AX52_9FLAO|nr:hypothetical protein [Aquimarina celericrescens]